MKIFHSLLFFLFPVVVFAGNPVENFVKSPMMESANISILFRDANTGQVLYQSRAKNVVTPASTMKLVTTATAFELLTPDARFETRLEIDGVIRKDSTLWGNLYIHGGGDPTLGSEKLGEKNFLGKWVSAVKAAGIKKINGRIIADESVFEQQVINPKWTWEDMGNYYAPGIHGISYLDNTFRLVFRSGKVGTTPEILRTEPPIPGLVIDNHLKSSTINFDNAYFYGAPNSLQRSIYGEIPANKNEFAVKGDIVNPGLLLVQDFSNCLADSGIVVGESPAIQSYPTAERKAIYAYLSPAMRDIVTETNVKSNNHFAEYVFKFIGTKVQPVATTNASLEIIRDYWKSKGLPVDQLFMYDGCGLSASDAVSANFLVELLMYMKSKSPYATDFYNSLPVTGGRGTLSNLLLNTPLQGKIHAKSGTIENVKCYAGYMELKNKTLVFALMVNHANGTSKAVTAKMEELLLQVARENQ
ncbi:MAG TPA: D-alanyl-D-alanine carboxypeptidase/D-alanyl-D-alanine-endopeptidase [Paludibacter sp.]|nr:D-alanyl-D-alanine carboxypeptidase/D-alanyl-D-alanine-endopeptidase [Paludibacter sp.]